MPYSVERYRTGNSEMLERDCGVRCRKRRVWIIGNQVQVLSDPVTVSSEQTRNCHCAARHEKARAVQSDENAYWCSFSFCLAEAVSQETC